ncbi:prolyl oligopeptidase family serine peptidase [Massilibacteroides sp.]|uniref:prolyl oligopeptidase family serine peptidase n=1 Tax=Massilibacteroides sp. TaxID=2034766 RepID=UPI002629A38B|nr:prolyl oligopeptidase family serine peptidase [Massilibacteroides sp.]MDD4515788.1 prolyl oligopeptidase family serine peptidase [Massilibacteroides sp.]
MTKESEEKTEIWNKIVPFFSPEAQFANIYGDYRSPLLFKNGQKVKTKEEWFKRRQEIRVDWMSRMGKWPPIMTDQVMKIVKDSTNELYDQYKVSFNWTPTEKTEGYLLVPHKKGKKPAVISVFYEPETAIGQGKPLRDFAFQLAKRGFVTLSLGTSETSKNKTYSIYYPSIDNATMQPLSTLAYAAANAWEVLAKADDVDSTRIGIVGHSYGGKWAMFASCLYDKFACAAWSDPGIVFDETKGSGVNYWEPWYLGYYPPPWENTWNKTSDGSQGIYSQLRKDSLDLHELHALMAPRPFLVSGGSSDPPERWIPLNHSIAVNELLGYKNRVAMTNRETHGGTVESNEQMYLFFEYFLKF